MKALTIWPEWAWAICQLGKDIENRTWSPPASVIGHRIAIHAGKNVGGRYDPARREAIDYYDLVAEMAGRAGIELRHIYHDGNKIGFSWYRFEEGHIKDVNRFFASLPRGGILATARIAGWSRSSDSPWAADGQVHWQLEDVQVLRQLIPCRGAQGLWSVPEAIESKIHIASVCPTPPSLSCGEDDKVDGEQYGQLALF